MPGTFEVQESVCEAETAFPVIASPSLASTQMVVLSSAPVLLNSVSDKNTVTGKKAESNEKVLASAPLLLNSISDKNTVTQCHWQESRIKKIKKGRKQLVS